MRCRRSSGRSQCISARDRLREQRANDEHEARLRERIEALQRREYRAPVKPLACNEEREAALLCYRGAKGKQPGDIVLGGQKAVDDLDRCAALLRDASMSKIVKGVLESA